MRRSPVRTMRSFGLMGEYSTPMRTWFGPGVSGSGDGDRAVQERSARRRFELETSQLVAEKSNLAAEMTGARAWLRRFGRPGV
jgi:hypothetical protein